MQHIAEEAIRFDKARHVKYWKRCLQTPLPHHYTSFDSNRMYLGYFSLSALDLLGSLESATTSEDRLGYVEWIYSCQHVDGGFRMWRGTDFGSRATQENAKWDPATVPATYFALASLLILQDDFKRVRRRKTLEWLQRMQREDGSFGEILIDGKIQGGRDPRAGYCATAIRHVLRGDRRDGSIQIDGADIADIDINGLVRCIGESESFEGGIADQAFHEPHAGYTFCSLGALTLVGRLQKEASSHESDATAPRNPDRVLHWLVSRQTDFIDPDLPPYDDQLDETESHLEVDPQIALQTHQSPDKSTMWANAFTSAECSGMNGRVNKAADTCYAFWVCASLHILGHLDLCDKEALRRYLLSKTQHPVLGGFGKFPGDIADLYHSHLGLVAYALVGGGEVEEADATLCISKRVRQRLSVLWQAWSDHKT
ncbi:terpenoid cyclases/Protein prenyltransferase [Polychaeton citri CBS 116435]|uniref:Terpenoid cyclases/Protein prenyltransferase n=1 Tax=Polychaeton citri CBS 116435 TaxID=1314669 RepID=A0A9P4UUD2_9PEZI|nr:terpenoid cyclases/Protein prenyltransferase [Polychaeton citri CBS 116435]